MHDTDVKLDRVNIAQRSRISDTWCTWPNVRVQEKKKSARQQISIAVACHKLCALCFVCRAYIHVWIKKRVFSSSFRVSLSFFFIAKHTYDLLLANLWNCQLQSAKGTESLYARFDLMSQIYKNFPNKFKFSYRDGEIYRIYIITLYLYFYIWFLKKISRKI